MKQEERIQGTTRQAEESFLEQTLSVIRDNLESYGRQVDDMSTEIDVMLDHFHDDNPELINALENLTTMHLHMKRALERNEKAQGKPYFGRIVFRDEALDKVESLYIGRGGIAKDATHQIVIDWRAPVANAYYENGLGKCSYMAPGDRRIDIDLMLKRTYEIESGKLLDYFDSEVVANDDLLTKYLAKNKQAVLSEIVATIQKEQNEIIRKSPHHNIIVQGVAGSGKTTVAMHRISFILYNYPDRFKPDDFYIVGSNRILLNYITGVLPDLDVYGIRQMTMEELFVRLLYEDWDEKRYRILRGGQSGDRGSIKGGLGWFRDLQAYCDKLEWEGILRESIYLNPRQFVEGLRDGKSGVYDETVGKKVNPHDLILLVDGEAVERYILQNPKVSMQNKINMLNDRLIIKIKEEFLGKGVKYTEPERKAILKAYRGRYGGKVWKGSIYDLYRKFLELQALKGKAVDIPADEFDVYDLAALAYLYKRIKETEVISEAHHIVIDEAQDFGMMAYSVLHFCIKDCTYTVMGDVSQNIHFGFGLNDWEELRELLLPDQMDSFGILKKSYRNTVEISDFATGILHHGSFSSYPVEPIIRHGCPVAVLQRSENDIIREAADICRAWQEKGYDTIAVVCRNQHGANWAAKELGQYLEVMESDLEKAVFGNGVMVLPVEYTKGLEFDTVLILDPTRAEYPVDDGHAKLLYVAATRALHELCVLHTKDLTGLIADPVPERKEAPPEPVDKNMTDTSSSRDMRTAPGTAGRIGGRDDAASAGRLSGGEKEGTDDIGGGSAAKSAAARPDAERPGRMPTAGAASDRRAAVSASPIRSRVSIVRNTAPTGGPEPSGRPGKAAPRKAPERTAARPGPALPAFGDIPPTEKLRPLGHAKIDLSVRWVTKQPDGLYLQSRYGTLRLSPVGSAIVRVSFLRGGQPDGTVHPAIAVDRTDKFWMYKDTGKLVELTTDELLLQVDKATGAVRYLALTEEEDSAGRAKPRLLLAERPRECRQLETAADRKLRTWLYLDWARDERLYGFGMKGQPSLSLRGGARYISQQEGEGLPFFLSDRGYGILAATEHPAFVCDIPAYGSYLYTENHRQMDFYFIAGKRQETILKAYAYLCGTL
ncbi:ATP-binding domain-containing protein [uncultured Acetatifactor sp.]|uniref:ATP-binding domain-containing protein n=1 Tax=uncultured Acetatifactor sp. TaxID=1671927 RepID=UPI00261B5661|nr:ATP-binding domain-containing protein [uncultured Acetatifactor sp.]